MKCIIYWFHLWWIWVNQSPYYCRCIWNWFFWGVIKCRIQQIKFIGGNYTVFIQMSRSRNCLPFQSTWACVAWSLVFCVIFFWILYYLSFFDLQLLQTFLRKFWIYKFIFWDNVISLKCHTNIKSMNQLKCLIRKFSVILTIKSIKKKTNIYY